MAEFFWAKTAQSEQAKTGVPEYDRERRAKRDEEAAVHLLPIDEIRPNPAQPRKVFAPEAISSLADSIRRYGMIQPLTVRRAADGFELIAGERRLRAATLLGMRAVPAVILQADERTSAALAIIENIQRENLNMFEQAAAFSSLIRLYELTQDEIAARLSVSQSFVANKLRLLRYLPDEREMILTGGLTERHARALLRLSGDDRLTALRHVMENRLNVAETEAFVESVLHPPAEDAESAKKEEIPAEKPVIPKNRPAILRDVRLFYNSVNHAVDIMRQAGVHAVTQRRETDEGTEIRILIKREA